MDKETIKVYNSKADYFFKKYSENKVGIAKYFHIAFDRPQSILDIGSGCGRDLNELMRFGHNIKGIEPSSELHKLSQSHYPGLQGKIFVDQLPELNSLSNDEKFDGIICSAILMHIPQIQLFDSVGSIKNHLNTGGRLLISIPNAYPNIDHDTNRDLHGRLFNGLSEGQLSLLLERNGFRLIERWEDKSSAVGQEFIWITLLMSYELADKSKPLDSIEAILNKDRKVTTYKLALFRALAEIASKNLNAVRWNEEGDVLLPVELVIDKWIEYYWPIFECEEFIPQLQKESLDSLKLVSFRKALTNLIDFFRHSGGYEAFHIDKMKLKFDTSLLGDIGQLKNNIKRTIINGPVKHAGGYNTANKLLGYNSKSESIVVPMLIWKELTLLGNWIIDATILRWSELTSKFSRGRIKPGKIIDYLLIEEKSRQINDARNIYSGVSDLRCTWTNVAIKKFDVDHIIPFSLWKNNDLWNLVPTKNIVNRSKSDKLVTNSHLIKSKDLLIFYWKESAQKDRNRFLNESKILTGKLLDKNNWEMELFLRLKEAVEYTAFQRGVERWEPDY